MNDGELTEFLGIVDLPLAASVRFISTLSVEQRALFDKMKAVERWEQGLGPLPDGVQLCWAADYAR